MAGDLVVADPGAAGARRQAAWVPGSFAACTLSLSSIQALGPVAFAMFGMRSWPVSSGAPLSTSDVDGGTKVAVLGQTVADKLFGAGADPVGQTIRIKNTPFQVAGVLARKGQ